MRRFKLEKLPKYAKEKIHKLNFYRDDDNILRGEVWLKDGWLLYPDFSHYFRFNLRGELIYKIKNFTLDEKIIKVNNDK